MTRKFHKSEAEWRSQLTAEQFAICRCRGTEAAFSGKYHDCNISGIYHCRCCNKKLFSSLSKFDSGTGWPSFYEPYHPNCIETAEDRSHGMLRTEVCCSSCSAHLGHVFPDGPKPTGRRYCINSAALVLEKNI